MFDVFVTAVPHDAGNEQGMIGKYACTIERKKKMEM